MKTSWQKKEIDDKKFRAEGENNHAKIEAKSSLEKLLLQHAHHSAGREAEGQARSRRQGEERSSHC